MKPLFGFDEWVKFSVEQEGEEYEGFEYVGIFDWYVLDPPPPVVTDEWVDLHIGG